MVVVVLLAWIVWSNLHGSSDHAGVPLRSENVALIRRARGREGVKTIKVSPELQVALLLIAAVVGLWRLRSLQDGFTDGCDVDHGKLLQLPGPGYGELLGIFHVLDNLGDHQESSRGSGSGRRGRKQRTVQWRTHVIQI